MSDSFEQRIQRIVRQVLDTRVDLLALMMAEMGVPEGAARLRLVELVTALTGRPSTNRRRSPVRARTRWAAEAGLSLEESALALGISLSTAKRHWAYARAWLAARLGDG